MDTRKTLFTVRNELSAMINRSSYLTFDNASILSLIKGITQLRKLHPLEQMLFSVIRNRKVDSITRSKQLMTVLDGIKKITEVKRKENAEAIAIFESLQKETGIALTQEEILPGVPTINAQEDDDSTALIVAASNGDLDSMQILIEAGADIDRQNHYGETALIKASSNGHLHCIDFLLQKNAKSDLKNTSGYNAFIIAAMNGHADCASALSKVFNPDKDQEIANKALKELLEKKYNKNSISEKMKHMEGVRCLIRIAKADVNAQYIKFKMTPLLVAAEYNNAPGLEVLIAEKANIDFKYENGRSALLIAISNTDLECIRLLMKAGAKEKNLLEKILKERYYNWQHDPRILSVITYLIECGETISNRGQLKSFLKLQDPENQKVSFCYDALKQQKQAKQSTPYIWAGYFGATYVSTPGQKNQNENQKNIPAGNDSNEATPLLQNHSRISQNMG